MFFADLQAALLEQLRTRVRNGDITERRLAKIVGVSQPHIHNVLKGARTLTPALADDILQELRLSLLDLVGRERMAEYLAEIPAESETAYVPVLAGRLGPGHPWPQEAGPSRMALPSVRVAAMTAPVVVELAADARMESAFTEGDYALLDQSRRARCSLDPAGLYVVKTGNHGLLRRLRTAAGQIYMTADDALTRPAAWERLALETYYVQHVVRARAMLVGRQVNWRGSGRR